MGDAWLAPVPDHVVPRLLGGVLQAVYFVGQAVFYKGSSGLKGEVLDVVREDFRRSARDYRIAEW